MNRETRWKSLGRNAPIQDGGRDDKYLGPRLLTVKQAGRYLGSSPEKVRRLINQRQLTATKVGAHWRISVDDILKFITSNISRRE